MTEEYDARRRELLDSNLKAWKNEKVFPVSTKLDSSLKKNSAFIKRIKTPIASDSVPAILREVGNLSLEKYLTEIVSSAIEGVQKVGRNDEVVGAVELLSALHQRFSDNFTPYVMSGVICGLPLALSKSGSGISKEEKDNEEQQKVLKQKQTIKLLMELHLVGLLRTFKDCDRDSLPENISKRFSKLQDEAVVVLMLKDTLSRQINSGCSLSVAQLFLKRFQHLIYVSSSDLISDSLRATLQSIFKIYTNGIFGALVLWKQKVQSLKESHKRTSIRTGKLSDESVNELNNVVQTFEKFVATSQYLSILTGLETPDCSINEDTPEVKEEVIKNVVPNTNDLGAWDSLREKNFYTKFPDISTSGKSNQQQNTSLGDSLNEFFKNLENVSNEAEIDSLSCQFMELKLNNKATRNRLMKFFVELQSTTRLKYYARFLKITAPYNGDLIREFTEYLDKGFRSQLYQNRLILKNIFFFCELIKFGLIPPHVIFHKIRSLTLNISSTNNIDILSVFYEQCGRFLMYEPAYSNLMAEMIELLKTKQKNELLSVNDKLAINNILNIVLLPDTKLLQNIESVDQPPLHQFIVRVLKFELNKKTSNIVLKLLKKIDYKNDIAIQNLLADVFSSPDDMSFESITEVYKICDKITKKCKSVLVKTIDALAEKTIRGVEMNDYRQNRARVSYVKALGELYNLKLLTLKFVLDLCYKILSFGHPNNQPLPMNYEVSIDRPDNFFRVLLCSTFLNSLSSVVEPDSTKLRSRYLKKKNSENLRQLKQFLLFFEYYCFTKEKLPIDIEFSLDEMYHKFYPLVELSKSANLQENIIKLQEIIKINSNSLETEASKDDKGHEDNGNDNIEVNSSSEEDDDISEDSDNTSDADSQDYEDFTLSDDNDETKDGLEGSQLIENEDGDDYETSDSDSSREDSESDTFYGYALEESEEDKRLSDDFAKEVQKIVLDSMEQNKGTTIKKSNFNVPLPTNIRSEQTNSSNNLKFGLLTRSGKKASVKEIKLLSDNKVAESVLKEKAAQQTHREKIMDLVMNMDN
ncbi:Piso0_001766 [Millerozyma farinosa CBS 7064]|uniref:Piso0_001766 protein n=1 Tax=Pichia sorbitophila (strain ATCC MYA-4447 / BCRC 22081 / CBS 7064 / NBRC 10061 / NRRL Y-12695) TaxID=559304 RepID=G8YP16_PICSO|nr:Piso0_001766 [Millerozyma farinosa CBS 7064]